LFIINEIEGKNSSHMINDLCIEICCHFKLVLLFVLL